MLQVILLESEILTSKHFSFIYPQEIINSVDIFVDYIYN